MTLLELVEKFGANALHNQYALGDYLSEHTWNIDVVTGVISFGNGRDYPFQLLGSESQYDRTWLWAWANSQIDPSPASLRACLRMRELGEQERISEFREPEFEIRDLDGHMIAMVSAGIYGAPCYYRCPYDGGAAFVLVEIGDALQPAPHPLLRMQTVFTSFISTFPLPDHRAALVSYAALQSVDASADGDRLVLRDRHKINIPFSFTCMYIGMHGRAERDSTPA